MRLIKESFSPESKSRMSVTGAVTKKLTFRPAAVQQLWWVFTHLRAQASPLLSRLEPALIFGAGLFATGLQPYSQAKDLGELLVPKPFADLVKRQVAHYLPQMVDSQKIGEIESVSQGLGLVVAQLVAPGVHHALAAAALSTPEDMKRQLHFVWYKVYQHENNRELNALLRANFSKVVVLLCWISAREPEAKRVPVAHRAIVRFLTAMHQENFMDALPLDQGHSLQPANKRRRTSAFGNSVLSRSNKPRRGSIGFHVADYPEANYNHSTAVEDTVEQGQRREEVGTCIQHNILHMAKLFEQILAFEHGEDLVDKDEKNRKLHRKDRTPGSPCDFDRFFSALRIFFDLFVSRHIEHMGSKLLELMRTATRTAIKLGRAQSAVEAWSNLLNNAKESEHSPKVLPYAAVFTELAQLVEFPNGVQLLSDYGHIMRSLQLKTMCVPEHFIRDRNCMQHLKAGGSKNPLLVGKYVMVVNSEGDARRGGTASKIVAQFAHFRQKKHDLKLGQHPDVDYHAWQLRLRSGKYWNLSHCPPFTNLEACTSVTVPLVIAPVHLIPDTASCKSLRNLWLSADETADVRARRTLEQLEKPDHHLQRVALVSVLRSLLLESRAAQIQAKVAGLQIDSKISKNRRSTVGVEKTADRILSDDMKTMMMWPILKIAQSLGQETNESDFAMIGETLGLVGLLDPETVANRGALNSNLRIHPDQWFFQEYQKVEQNQQVDINQEMRTKASAAHHVSSQTWTIAMEIFEHIAPLVDVDEYAISMQDALKVVARCTSVYLPKNTRYTLEHLENTVMYQKFSRELKSVVAPFVHSNFVNKSTNAEQEAFMNGSGLQSVVVWVNFCIRGVNEKCQFKDTYRHVSISMIVDIIEAVVPAIQVDRPLAAKLLPIVTSLLFALFPDETYGPPKPDDPARQPTHPFPRACNEKDLETYKKEIWRIWPQDKDLYERLVSLLTAEPCEPAVVTAVFETVDAIRLFAYDCQDLRKVERHDLFSQEKPRDQNKNSVVYRKNTFTSALWIAEQRAQKLFDEIVLSRAIVSASLNVGAFQRALMYLELAMVGDTQQLVQVKKLSDIQQLPCADKYVGDSYPFLEPAPSMKDVQTIQKIYQKMHEDQGLRGLLKVASTNAPSEESIRGVAAASSSVNYCQMARQLVSLYEQRGDFNTALDFHNDLWIHGADHVPSSNVVDGFVRCNQSVGRWGPSAQMIGDSWRDVPQLHPRAVRAAWELGDWSKLDELLENNFARRFARTSTVSGAFDATKPSTADADKKIAGLSVTDISDFTMGRLMRQFHKGKASYSDALDTERANLVRHVAAASRETYQRVFPHLALLHAGEDLLELQNVNERIFLSDDHTRSKTFKDCEGAIEIMLERALPIVQQTTEHQKNQHVHCIRRALDVLGQKEGLLQLTLWEQKLHRKQSGSGRFKACAPWWVVAPPGVDSSRIDLDDAGNLYPGMHVVGDSPEVVNLRKQCSIEWCKHLYTAGDLDLALKYIEPLAEDFHLAQEKLDRGNGEREYKDRKKWTPIGLKAALLRLRWQLETGASRIGTVAEAFGDLQWSASKINDEKHSRVTFHFAQFLDKQLESRFSHSESFESKASKERGADDTDEVLQQQAASSDAQITSYLCRTTIQLYIQTMHSTANLNRTYLVMNRLVMLISEATSKNRSGLFRYSGRPLKPGTPGTDLEASKEVVNILKEELIKKGQIPLKFWFSVMPQVISRACSTLYEAEAVDFFVELLSRIYQQYPLQSAWYVTPLHFYTTDNSKSVGKAIFQNVRSAFGDHDVRTRSMHKFFDFMRSLAVFCEQGDTVPEHKYHFDLDRDCHRSHFTNLRKVRQNLDELDPACFPLVPQLNQLSLSGNCQFGPDAKVTKIQKLHTEILVLRSKQKPKKISFVGTDGRKYGFLCKQEKRGDLRKDSRMMELCHLFNELFTQMNDQAARKALRIRTFMVVSISSGYGMIEWIDGLDTYGNILKKEYQKVGMNTLAPRQYLTNAMGGQNQNKNFDMLPGVWGKVKREFLPMFHRWFAGTSTDPAHWYSRRLEYSGSMAVMSMICFLMGVGDRHCDNMLLDVDTAEVVHVDFDCLFGKGGFLAQPEIVPFRLTQNLVAGMGVCGVNGVFRSVCESTIRLIRREKELLFSALSTFVADPLMEVHNSQQHEERAVKDRMNKAIKSGRKPSSADQAALHRLRQETTNILQFELEKKIDGYVNFSRDMTSYQERMDAASEQAKLQSNTMYTLFFRQ